MPLETHPIPQSCIPHKEDLLSVVLLVALFSREGTECSQEGWPFHFTGEFLMSVRPS